MIPLLEITPAVYALTLLGAFSLGMSKTGLPGLALLNVIIMAHLFGKESVGIVLPMLVFCDLVIYPIYRRYSSWGKVWPLMIPAVVGVLIGYWILGQIQDDTTMKRAIGWTIAAMLVLQIVRARSQSFLEHLPDSRSFLISSGLAIGTSTTVANAAGPAYSIWALVKNLSKEDFLGIGARFFLCINLLKVPFNLDLGIINERTIKLDLALLPAILLGIYIGRQIVKRIPQKAFEWVLFCLSAAGAAWLIVT